MLGEEQLLTNGVMGVMLGWFMFRTEKVINANTEATNQLKETLFSIMINKEKEKN